MTPVFCCGFECGQLGTTSANNGQHWIYSTVGSVTPSFSTSIKRSDYRSLRINPSSVIVDVRCGYDLGLSGVVVGRFYIYFSTLPSANINLMSAHGSGGNMSGGVRYNSSDQKIYASEGDGISLGSTGVSVSTGNWYLIDFKISYTDDTVDVKVNGTSCGQVTASNVSGLFSTLRMFSGIISGDWYIDDFMISLTSGDYPLGAGKILSYLPDSDGTHTSTGTTIVKGTTSAPTGGGAITAATTDAYQRVNARPLNGGQADSTYLINQQSNGAVCAEVDFESTLESSPPRLVTFITSHRQAGTANGSFEIDAIDNGSGYVIHQAIGTGGSTSDRYATKSWDTMPNGGGAWTIARFNALKAQFGYSADANPDQYWRGIMIEAEFEEVAVTIPNKIVQVKQAVNRANTY